MKSGLVALVTTLAPLLFPGMPWWVKGWLIGLVIVGGIIHLVFKDMIALQRVRNRRDALPRTRQKARKPEDS